MNTHALLGLSALMSFVGSGVAANLFLWPRRRIMSRSDALLPLLAPHVFLRTIGLSFLVPGVVSPSLPAAFAVPAAYGDFVAGILAVAATLALAKRASWAIVLVWVFNVWGAGDLLNAIYQGNVRAKLGDILHSDGSCPTIAGRARTDLLASASAENVVISGDSVLRRIENETTARGSCRVNSNDRSSPLGCAAASL